MLALQEELGGPPEFLRLVLLVRLLQGVHGPAQALERAAVLVLLQLAGHLLLGDDVPSLLDDLRQFGALALLQFPEAPVAQCAAKPDDGRVADVQRLRDVSGSHEV